MIENDQLNRNKILLAQNNAISAWNSLVWQAKMGFMVHMCSISSTVLSCDWSRKSSKL